MSFNNKNLLEGDGLCDRLLVTSLVASMVGRQLNVTIRGKKTEVEAISRALAASKNLHETLHSSGATINTILESLRNKQAAALEFERISGIPWPL